MAPPTSIISASESSYIISSLLLPEPIRTDGRGLHDFRPFSLTTGVAPQANGSARVLLGSGGAGGTEVVTAVRLEVGPPPVGSAQSQGSSVGSRPDVVCSIECTPSAFPYLDYKAVEVQSQYLTTLLQHTIPSLLPPLRITDSLSFHYTIDVLINQTGGNLVDTLFLSVRSALCDLKVPRTKNVAFEAAILEEEGESDMAGIKGAALGNKKKLDQRNKAYAAGAEFDLEDFGDEGEYLPAGVRDSLPVCITLNVLPNSTHFLDATAAESLASPSHLLLFVTGKGDVAGLRFVGNAEIGVSDIARLTAGGKTVGLNLIAATNAQLKSLQASKATAGGFTGGLGFFGS